MTGACLKEGDLVAWAEETLDSYHAGDFASKPKTPELIGNLCDFIKAQIEHGRLHGDERLAIAVQSIKRHAQVLSEKPGRAMSEFCCGSIIKHGDHILRMLRSGAAHGLGQAYTTEAVIDICAVATAVGRLAATEVIAVPSVLANAVCKDLEVVL